MDSSHSAPPLVEQLIARAERARASDIHLQMLPSSEAEISFRLDGLMTPAGRFPSGLAERIFGRLKFLARLKTYQDSHPQDGRIPRGEVGSSCDVRVATYPTVTGEKIVLRLFTEQPAKSLADLRFPAPAREALERTLRRSSGLVLLTGPAGSGKTETIYACLRALVAAGGRHVITVEDPVEQIIPGVMQTEVNEPRGLTFAAAARHLLRQDPQVLVIGEVRDEETARIAVRAASTGHLVITTVHAGSCAGVIERLTLLADDRFSVVSSLELILSQRLARQLCGRCGGQRCADCLETGFSGRVPLVEFVLFDEAQRSQWRSRSGPIHPGLTLREAGEQLVRQGVTTEAEIARVLGPENPGSV